mmetsp:Transcript_18267/g.18341  ORF Transcript_18267/g.18341 Transcript_18267/m.18341 type:complete len:220 (-) Transcript_18267:490-1149(-)
MGAAVASLGVGVNQSEEELVELMMPPYYIKNVIVTDSDIAVGRLSWKKISDGSSQAYMAMKESPDFTESSCLTWFYSEFYGRMFDINPGARPLFKTNLMSQGRVLMGIITTALNQLKNSDKFHALLVNLTHLHSQRGIRGMQYGIAGDVLFWTLRKVLGSEDFDEETYKAWIHIFSYMLSIMVPVAVADEVEEIKLIRKGIIPADTELMKTPRIDMDAA